MKKLSNPKTELLEHSKAKVDLYIYYFSIYLNILHRAGFQKIYIYDLFAGEGIYENGEKGSAVLEVEKIRDHYNNNYNTCPNIKLILNDEGNSEIEEDILKIERVKRECEVIQIPDNVEIVYTKRDYNEIIHEIIEELNSLENNERALLFLDPYGYKDIDLEILKTILSNKKTEVILFLPIDHMYRFIEKSKDEKFQGGFQLRKFMSELFPKGFPTVDSPIEFINILEIQLHKYLDIFGIDTFTIEKQRNKFYTLFFFTNNERGFCTWLESKWKLDEEEGTGYRFDGNIQALFSLKKLNYQNNLIKFLKEKDIVTNIHLYWFGLNNGMLPKHSHKILTELKKEDRIEIISLDGKPNRSFYLNDKSRNVQIVLKN
ncbi:MAG: three-Cys-motif partner protein TcmP [FCB group bacterium]|jgi:three-Cys-motif partner protein